MTLNKKNIDRNEYKYNHAGLFIIRFRLDKLTASTLLYANAEFENEIKLRYGHSGNYGRW